MSDINSSLPIRTESAGDIIAKIADATTPSQQLAVDSSGRITAIIQASGTALTATGSSLNVNMTNSLSVGVADKTTYTYGTTTFLPVGGVFQDTSPSLTAGQSGAARLTANRGLHVNLRDASGTALLGSAVSASSIPVVIASDQGAIPVTQSGAWTTGRTWSLSSGTDSVAAVQSGTWTVQPGNTANTTPWLVTVSTALPTGANTIGKVDQGNGGSAAQGWFSKITDGTNTAAVKAASTAAAASDPSLVVALSPNSPVPAGSNNIGKVSIQDSSGAAFSKSNPLFVTTSDNVGTEIDNYNTSAALAAAGTSNHDYTVTAAKTFYTEQIYATGSGKLKIEVQYETGAATGVFNTAWVGFNSTSDPQIIIPVPSGKTQVAGARIRVIRTNLDKSAQDVYSTISGSEQT